MNNKISVFQKIACISTAHVSSESMAWLENIASEKEPNKTINVMVGYYGAFIYISEGDDENEELPEDIRNIIAYAEKESAGYILLDRDNEIIADLKEYEWPSG